MTTLHAVAALFALFMLFRHGPGALALLRSGTRGRPMALVSAVNVVLALVILGFALRGLVLGRLPR